MREKIIKNITDFPLICYDFIIFSKYDILTRALFRGKERLDGFSKTSGGRLNKKDGLTRYGNSHVKDKTS